MSEEKKVLAFSLFGVIKNEEPWKIAHKNGMRELSELADMPELIKKINEKDYFDYVKKALEKIEGYKELPINERLKKRREKYFNNVLTIIKQGDYIDKEFIDFLKELKEKYELMLITTNIESFVKDILSFIGEQDLFDYVVFSEPHQEDNKKEVFLKAINNFKKPGIYIGSDKSFNVCNELEIKFIKYEEINKLKEFLK